MITFTADGKDYKLEVTAFTIKQMEKSGVNFAQLGEKLLAVETLWKGLFIDVDDVLIWLTVYLLNRDSIV